MKIYHSEIIGQDYFIKDGIIKFRDQVTYSRREVERLRDVPDEVKKPIHNIKKVFNGEYIGVRNGD